MRTTTSTGSLAMTSNSGTHRQRELGPGAKIGLTLLGLVSGSALAALLYARIRKHRQPAEPGRAPVRPVAPDQATPGPSLPVQPIAAVYPLPMLDRGRKPRITSHHKARNPSRPTHDGVDFFYPVLPGDPEWKLGDGEGTSNGAWIVPPGTPAIAVNAGRVQRAGNTPTGWRIWVDHGPVRTGYFHLAEIFVREGDHVDTGQQLGIVGDNPRDRDARHLHFEVSAVHAYAPVDPVPFLQGAAFLPLAESPGPIRAVEITKRVA